MRVDFYHLHDSPLERALPLLLDRALQAGLRAVVLSALLGLLVAGCVTAPRVHVSVAELPREQQARAEQNLKVFYAVWDLVNRKHYDPQIHGVDWEKTAATFGPRVAGAPDEKALYAALNAPTRSSPIADRLSSDVFVLLSGERR